MCSYQPVQEERLSSAGKATVKLLPSLVRRSNTFTTLLWAFVLLALPRLSEPVPITVPGDYSTIQLAVDSANTGDEILVSDGVYNENIVIPDALDGLSIVSVNGREATSIVGISDRKSVV